MSANQTVEINSNANASVLKLGATATPVFILDNAVKNPEQLIELARQAHFKSQASDYYPGLRASIGCDYIEALSREYTARWKSLFELQDLAEPAVVLSAFSLTVTPESQLKPIQMLPHFDTPQSNQMALVHYLCDEQHGGTGFFRHKSTGIERVTESNFSHYGQTLKHEAINAKLHVNPQYVGVSHSLFESIGSVKAQFNRLIVYPSNLLHSGLIQPATDLNPDPIKGRLTTSSFVKFV